MPDDPHTYKATKWYRTSAFRAWWKATTASLTIPATGGMTWRSWAISAGVALAAASWEIWFAADESFREVTPPVPTSPPDPGA